MIVAGGRETPCLSECPGAIRGQDVLCTLEGLGPESSCAATKADQSENHLTICSCHCVMHLQNTLHIGFHTPIGMALMLCIVNLYNMSFLVL